MLTRKECEELVAHPGKFENEPPYTPYFYYYATVDNTDTVDVIPADVKMFPELKGIRAVRVKEDQYDFVTTKLIRR